MDDFKAGPKMTRRRARLKPKYNPMAKKNNGCEFQRKIMFFVLHSMTGVKINYTGKKNDFCVITLIAKKDVSPMQSFTRIYIFL